MKCTPEVLNYLANKYPNMTIKDFIVLMWSKCNWEKMY